VPHLRDPEYDQVLEGRQLFRDREEARHVLLEEVTHPMVVSRGDATPDEAIPNHQLQEVDGRGGAVADVLSVRDARMVGEDHKIRALQELDGPLVSVAAQHQSPSRSPLASHEHQRADRGVVQEVLPLIGGGRLALLRRDQERGEDGLGVIVSPLHQGSPDAGKVHGPVPQERLGDGHRVLGSLE
jgi:hypothetical protein